MALTNAQIPWPGPRPYDESDWKRFFGRDRDVNIIVNKLATERLTILLGASGSGKTSLIRAGLVPRLRNQRYHPISRVSEGPVLVFRGWGAGSNDSLRDLMEQQLHNAVDAIATWHDKYSNPPKAAQDLKELKEVLATHKGQEVVPTIEALAQAVANRPPTNGPTDFAQEESLILVFDQLEELLRSRDPRSERETGKLGAEMLALIGDLFVRGRPLRMLISMRVEYLHALRPLDRSVARLSERCHYLEALSAGDARKVVASVSRSPGVIKVDDDITKDILELDRSAGAESSADLLRLQAMLYALSSQAGRLGLPAVNDALYRAYRAEMRLDDVFQKAVEEWIESAARGEVDYGGTRQSIESAEKFRTWTELADEDLLSQVRQIATRIAPYLSSSDYKVPQELNNLFRRALGQLMVTLVQEKPDSLGAVTIDFNFLDPDAEAPSVNWGGGDGELQWAQSDRHTSGTARTHRWSASKTADVIAACYLLTLQRFEDRNILRRTFNARNEIVVELVHDQMGPMLVRWAEKLQGGWWDCVSSLVALSGGHPITVQGDLIRNARFVALTWRGCTIQPRIKEQLTFESVMFEQCELRGIVFDRCTFRGVEFNDCALNGTIFRDCIFEPGPGSTRSVLIRDGRENELDCLLFVGCTISDVEFRNSIVRQPSIVASKLLGDVVFENCSVAQLYASQLEAREDAKIRIPPGNRAWCCSADEASFPRLEVKRAQYGYGTAPEPEDFVPDKPTAGPS